MERWQIIVVCVVVAALWMMFKKQRTGDGSGDRRRGLTIESEVESWHSRAQDRVAALPDDFREDREAAWDALDRAARIDSAEQFMSVRFGPRSLGVYSSDEKLKIGRVRYVADGPDSDPEAS